MTDDDVWKKRFIALTLVRLSGTVFVLIGLLVAFSDLFRTGGIWWLGILLMIAGMIDLAVLPQLLRRRWRQP